MPRHDKHAKSTDHSQSIFVYNLLNLSYGKSNQKCIPIISVIVQCCDTTNNETIRAVFTLSLKQEDIN